VHHRGDVARREGVQIELVLDRDSDGFVVHSPQPLALSP
jgi:hypothetical protein